MKKIGLLALSDAAKQKAKELLKKEENLKTKLRIFVVGGGCGGLRYGFALDKKIAKDDTIFDDLLVMDWVSVTYLKGATIDFKDEKFLIQNPNVRTGCSGCPLH